MTWFKSSIHWLLTSKQGFFSFQHELYTSGCWSPYIQWIIFFYFIFHAANIKSLIDCRFPEDGQDLLYSYGVLAMTLISFQHRDDLVNYRCKEIKQLTTPENTITYYNALCLSPQIVHKHCLQFLLGVKMAPREKENWNLKQCLPKILGWQKRALWYVMVFSGVVNCASSVGIPSHIAGTTGLKQRKLCTCSDWPCKMPRRMAKVESCCLRLNEFWCSQEFHKYVAALSGDWGGSHDVRMCFRVVQERYSLRPKMSRKES